MSDGICDSCKFLRASECRKNPPTIQTKHPTKMDVMTSDLPQYDSHRAVWPTVQGYNWCGEYEERPVSPARVIAETSLVDATLGLVEEVYVGEGKIVCPPALVPHIRNIVNALKPLSDKKLPAYCLDCAQSVDDHAPWCKLKESQ